MVPLHPHAVAFQPLLEQVLEILLGQDEQERVVAPERPQVDRRSGLLPVVEGDPFELVPPLDEPGDEPLAVRVIG